MPNWMFTVKFSPWYRDDTLSIEEKGKRAAAELRKLAANKRAVHIEDDLLLLAENFESVSSVEDFDDFMEALYDIGDLARIWVATI